MLRIDSRPVSMLTHAEIATEIHLYSQLLRSIRDGIEQLACYGEASPDTELQLGFYRVTLEDRLSELYTAVVFHRCDNPHTSNGTDC